MLRCVFAAQPSSVLMVFPASRRARAGVREPPHFADRLDGHVVVAALKVVAGMVTLQSESADCESFRQLAPVFHVG